MEVVCDKKRRSDYKGYDFRKNYQMEWERSNPEKVMLNRTRQRAKKKGLPFDLDLSDIVIPECCPVLGIPLVVRKGERSGLFPDSPSLDRIKPEKGYTKGNVRVISARANHLKSNASYEEIERVLEDLKKWK